MKCVRAAVAAVALVLALLFTASPASAAPDRVVGVSLPSYHYDAGAVTAYERSTGLDVDVVQTFISWQYTGQPALSDFPTAAAQGIAAVGASLEVTWVPANSSLGTNQPAFSLASIARGDHDAYITRFATAMQSFGQPVRLRLMHEMNGIWMSYNERNSGNKPGEFVQAWRHVHDVFVDVGATNVTWVWAPNIGHSGSTPVAGLYPGDAYVDEVGIDGYSYPTTGCPSPAKLYGATVTAIRALTSKPMRIAEVGVSTTCANRSAWFSSFFSYLETVNINGYTWWERNGDRDYRVVPTSALPAFRQAATTWVGP
jgi:hypothetical protein